MEYSIFRLLPDIINDSEKDLYVWRGSRLLARFLKENVGNSLRCSFISDDFLGMLILPDLFGSEGMMISMSDLVKISIHKRINLTLKKDKE